MITIDLDHLTDGAQLERAGHSLSQNLSMSPVDIPRQRESLQYQHVEEKLCIFDQFYRIPNHAPWKYSGPALELAVVIALFFGLF
jgi:hypothetical protein